MSIFFSLFSTGISSLFYGLILTAFIMSILYIALKLASKGIVKSLGFYITGPVLFIILWINSTIFCGAWQIKGMVDSMELWLNQQLYGLNGIVDLRESQEIGEELVNNFPILGSFFGLFDFSGNTYENLPSAMADTIRGELNSYMWSSTFWILGAMACAVIVALIFDKGENRKSVSGLSRRESGRYSYGGNDRRSRGRETRYSERRRAYSGR